MKTKEFNMLLDAQIERIKNKLNAKADEYATDEDRLHNFKKAADLEGVTPQQALAGMMAKHTISVYDMIGDEDHHSIPDWDEKITDHINYLILLGCLIREEEMEKKGFTLATEKVLNPPQEDKNDVETPKIDPPKPAPNITPADLARSTGRPVNA